MAAFRGADFFLSNFSSVLITLDGQRWQTAEHLFAAAKTADPVWQERIRQAPTPTEAKRLGQQAPLIPGWDGMRVEVMRQILSLKFAHGSALARKLVATGDRQLVETNEWGDQFWGVCNGRGENWLGRLLMERRALLAGALGPVKTTRVVNLHREPYDVYIGRAGKGQDGYFGNPYPLRDESMRDLVLEQWRKHFVHRIMTDPEFRWRVETLRGKRLGCFCSPKRCHGDVYVDYLSLEQP